MAKCILCGKIVPYSEGEIDEGLCVCPQCLDKGKKQWNEGMEKLANDNPDKADFWRNQKVS